MMITVGRALDGKMGDRGFDSQGQINTPNLKKKNKEMKVLPLPCKLQDVCVGKMTMPNGSPVSTGRCKNNVLNEYCCAK